jgi:hypothetical protein
VHGLPVQAIPSQLVAHAVPDGKAGNECHGRSDSSGGGIGGWPAQRHVCNVEFPADQQLQHANEYPACDRAPDVFVTLVPPACRSPPRGSQDQVRQFSPLPCERCSGVFGGSERPRKKPITPKAMRPMPHAKPTHCKTLTIRSSLFPGDWSRQGADRFIGGPGHRLLQSGDCCLRPIPVVVASTR